MIDPLTALGLAGNIVQFIDFTLTLVSGTRKIRDSVAGTGSHADQLQVIADQLRHRKSDLAEFSARSSASSHVDSELARVATDSETLADELISVVSTIKAKKPGKVWDSFKAALKEIWKEDQIQHILQRVIALQTVLNGRILYLLW
jgi:hypothetical protein